MRFCQPINGKGHILFPMNEKVAEGAAKDSCFSLESPTGLVKPNRLPAGLSGFCPPEEDKLQH